MLLTRIPLPSVLLVVFLAIPFAPPAALLFAEPAAPAHTWELGAAVFTGTCHPDLEKKYHDDLIGGAAILGGMGFATPWQSKGCTGFPLEIRHTLGRFGISGEVANLSSSHSFQRSIQYTTPSATAISVLDQIDVPVRASRSLALLADYSLHPDTPEKGFSLVGGFLSRSLTADLDVTRFGTYSNGVYSGSGISLFPTYSVLQTGRGPAFGVAYRSPILEALHLSFRLLLFNLHGIWQERMLQVDTTGSGGMLVRNEDGSFRMQGYNIQIGAETALPANPELVIFLRLRQDVSMNRDSGVNVTKAATGTQSVTTDNFIQDAALSHGGSSDRERFSGLDFGLKWRFL